MMLDLKLEDGSVTDWLFDIYLAGAETIASTKEG